MVHVCITNKIEKKLLTVKTLDTVLQLILSQSIYYLYCYLYCFVTDKSTWNKYQSIFVYYWNSNFYIVM